jgi:hypothetical protein
MHNTKSKSVPAALTRARRKLDRWRQDRNGRRKLPEALWAMSVELAGQYGVSETAAALNLNYAYLKQRAADVGVAVPDRQRCQPPPDPVAFVEVVPAPPQQQKPAHQCMIELQNSSGMKLQIQFPGDTMPDVSEITQAFFRTER